MCKFYVFEFEFVIEIPSVSVENKSRLPLFLSTNKEKYVSVWFVLSLIIFYVKLWVFIRRNCQI